MRQIKNMWFPNRDLKDAKAVAKANQMVDDYYFDALDAGIWYVKNRSIAIDGGANIGLWGIRMSKKFETVHSFEIDAETFECLQRNIELNNVENCIAHTGIDPLAPPGLHFNQVLTTKLKY